MFHVELAPLVGISGPQKSDLGVFWPFPATDFIMGILKIWDNLHYLHYLHFWNPRAICDNLALTKNMGVFFRLRTPSGPMC